jgi:sulfur-oxidizing protein SoxY
MKRRDFLSVAGAALAGAALDARAQTFQPAQDIAPLIAKITGGATSVRSGVEIELPALAENGNSVPMHIKVASSMSARITEGDLRPRRTQPCGRWSPPSTSERIRDAPRSRRACALLARSASRCSRSSPAGASSMASRDVLVTSAACLDESTMGT